MLNYLKIATVLAAGLSACSSPGAAQVKYTYLKIGEGSGATVYAFKSKQACEAAQRKFVADWDRMIRQLKKQFGNRGTSAAAPRVRCLAKLPLGFVRPKRGR